MEERCTRSYYGTFIFVLVIESSSSKATRAEYRFARWIARRILADIFPRKRREISDGLARLPRSSSVIHICTYPPSPVDLSFFLTSSMGRRSQSALDSNSSLYRDRARARITRCFRGLCMNNAFSTEKSICRLPRLHPLPCLILGLSHGPDSPDLGQWKSCIHHSTPLSGMKKKKRPPRLRKRHNPRKVELSYCPTAGGSPC